MHVAMGTTYENPAPNPPSTPIPSTVSAKCPSLKPASSQPAPKTRPPAIAQARGPTRPMSSPEITVVTGKKA